MPKGRSSNFLRNPNGKQRRGLGAASAETRSRVGRAGGKASQQVPTTHRWSYSETREATRKSLEARRKPA